MPTAQDSDSGVGSLDAAGHVGHGGGVFEDYCDKEISETDVKRDDRNAETGTME